MMQESMLLDRMLYVERMCRRGSILLCTLVSDGVCLYVYDLIKNRMLFSVWFLCIKRRVRLG